MKKILLALILVLAAPLAKADQLAWLTRSQAEKAVQFLKAERELMLFCACCSLDDERVKVSIEDVFFRHPSMGDQVYDEYYEVVVVGKTADGRRIEEAVDLAYVHIKARGGMANCLGVELGFECNPCTEPFRW